MQDMKFWGLWLGLCLLVAGCSDQEGAYPQGYDADASAVAEPQTQQRSEAEAKAEVQLFMEQLAPQVRTPYTITCADYVLNSSAAVRSGGETSSVDTLLYVLNVNNEKTAIVSGDLSTPAVLAVMDGKVSKNVLTQSTGTGFDGVAKSISDYTSSDEDTIEYAYKGVRERYYRGSLKSAWVQTIQKMPSLIKCHWDQHWPYNKEMPYLKDKDGSDKQAYAGCVPVAVAQLLTYYKYPRSLGGRVLDWDKIIADPQHDDIPFLLKTLAVEMGSEFRINGTSTDFEKTTAPVLNSYGYICKMKYRFTDGDLLSELLHRRPVLAWGENLQNESRSSHVWVIDGFLKREYTVVQFATAGFKGTKTTHFYNYYFHCNWGGGASYNGYFLSSLFNPFDIPKIADNTNRGKNYKPSKTGRYYDNYAYLFVELPK